MRIAALAVPIALLIAPLAAPAQEAQLGAKLEALAAEGNAAAAYHLGMLHEAGSDGAAKDQARALALFRQSAEAGDPLGAYKYGVYLRDGTAIAADPDAALAQLMVAAQAGHAVAQHDAAQLLYDKGSTTAALKWLEASARQGFQPSLQALSSLYSGEGKVEKNMGRSLAYLVLLHNISKKKPSPRIQQWMKETQAKLTPTERADAEDIVKSWKVQPSPLTLQAVGGKAAALRLAGLAKAGAAPAAVKSEPAKEPMGPPADD